jgi:hypothetical protein
MFGRDGSTSAAAGPVREAHQVGGILAPTLGQVNSHPGGRGRNFLARPPGRAYNAAQIRTPADEHGRLLAARADDRQISPTPNNRQTAQPEV